MRSVPTACLLLHLCFATVVANDRPNVVIVFAHGLSRQDVGCYGGSMPTPRIDKLSKKGVRYDTAWCVSKGAGATVSLLTGQYPFQHGWTHELKIGEEPQGWDVSRTITIGRALQRDGYATVFAGTWNIGELDTQVDGFSDYGFDEHCVWLRRANSVPDRRAPLAQKPDEKFLTVTNGVQDQPTEAFRTTSTFLRRFISQQSETPFLILCQIPVVRLHPAELGAGADASSVSSDGTRDDRVEMIDEFVGELMHSLSESGAERRTLVIVAGGRGMVSRIAVDSKQSSTTERVLTDAQVRVPLIVKPPFKVAGGRLSRDLVDFTDLLPTLLELIGISEPDTSTLAGRSLVPGLRGSEDPFEKRNWIYAQVGRSRILRDWQHVISNDDRFHDLQKDPWQLEKVSPLDKIAPGRRQRLEMILDRFSDRP